MQLCTIFGVFLLKVAGFSPLRAGCRQQTGCRSSLVYRKEVYRVLREETWILTSTGVTANEYPVTRRRPVNGFVGGNT